MLAPRWCGSFLRIRSAVDRDRVKGCYHGSADERNAGNRPVARRATELLDIGPVALSALAATVPVGVS